METVSVEELRKQISAGEYSIGSAELAGEIVTKFALIRRVGRLMSEDEEGAAGEADRGPQPRPRRRARSEPSRPTGPRRERLS